jgi:PAS domain S-box-containing protein
MNELERIVSSAGLAASVSQPDNQFEALTELAAFTFKAPIAVISLLDQDRQWFKARRGVLLNEAPRSRSFRDHVVQSDEVLAISDVRLDERFKEEPWTTGEPGVRFFMGAPLIMPSGVRVGALCVFDLRPRPTPNKATRDRLKALAASVMESMLVRAGVAIRAGWGANEGPAGLIPVEAEDRLKRLQWATNAYARATSALLHSGSFGDVAAQVCAALVEDDAYAAAFVGVAEHADGSPIKILARAGNCIEYVDALDLSWSDERWQGRGPTGRAIRSGEPEFVVDTHDSPTFSPWRMLAERYGIRSSVTVPFHRGEDVIGVVVVYGRQPNAFGPQEMVVFTQLAEELSFAIALEHERRDMKALKAAAADSASTLAELARSDSFYQMLAEHVGDVIVAYDLDGTLEYGSPSIRQLGYTPSEIIGRNVAEFLPSTTGVSPTMTAQELAEAFSAERGNISQILRRDGSPLWVQANPTKINDAEGRLTGIVTVLRNVEERLAVEDALRRKTEEAEAAAAAKAQFLANMSHEIRTPLTGILGFADLLARVPNLPDPAGRYVDRIVKGGQSLLALVNEILDFSRLDAGALEAVVRPVDVRALVDDIVEFLRPKAEEKGLTLARVGDAVLPACVATDVQRLRQILVNLITNAIKFTASGAVTVEALALPDQKLRFMVKDTGIGIPPDQVERIFQRFSQVDESSTRQYGGAGLGLAISKSLAELLGGEIGVESGLGTGSTFWFTIAAPAIGSEPPKDNAAATLADHLNPLKVLVVDDVEQNRELLRAVLTSFDAEVTEARDGQEAVEVADSQRFDVILMDLQMPRLDGAAAARAIRVKSALNQATPILAITADVLPNAVEACVAAGMNDHIAKPINVENLLSKIEHWTSL